MKVQTMIVLLFERMLALESTCVVKRFRVHRMCAPGSFIFYFFVACTRRHLGHIIAPLLVATLAHIAVVTAHIVYNSTHSGCNVPRRGYNSPRSGYNRLCLGCNSPHAPFRAYGDCTKNTKLFSPQTNNVSEKCPKLLRGKSTQHYTLPLKDRTICVSDLVKLNYFRMCTAVLTVKTLAFQRAHSSSAQGVNDYSPLITRVMSEPQALSILFFLF